MKMFFIVLVELTIAVTASKDLKISLVELLNSHHDEESPQLCVNSSFHCSQITCSNGAPLLALGYCATYDEKTKTLSLTKSSYYKLRDYNIASQHIKLPANLSQLNDYMCGPLNRKGLLCSECIDGFGPSVTSFKYKCVNCNHTWYGVPLFLFLELVPLTIFYVVILVFRIRMTSAPMQCFIIYSQLIMVAIDLTIYGELGSLRRIIFAENGDLRMIIKIIATIYGIFNLDFFHLVLPPFCVSSQLKDIHIAFLGYFSIFYPMFLIFLTWVCIQLHDHNFRPLVLLWKPFHRCCVQLRRGWNTKNDICDVFATFFLLSYTKTMHLTLLFLRNHKVYSIDKWGSHTVTLQPIVDRSILHHGMNHLLFNIPSLIFWFVFNIIPLLLLILYPIRAFRRCLEKCHLDFTSVSFFVEKMQGHYRNGLDGGRDMRSFSGFYFLLLVVMYFAEFSVHYSDYFKRFLSCATLLLIAALTVALIKPYQKTQNNVLGSLLLAHIAVIFTVLSADVQKLLVLNILLFFPFAAMILLLLYSKLYKVSHDNFSECTRYNCLQHCNICRCMKKKPTERSSTDSHLNEQSFTLSNEGNIDITHADNSGITQYGAC